MTKKIKLSINKHSYLKICYDFNVKKYADGDAYVEFYFHNRKLFRRLTQLKYFVQLLLNLLNLCIKNTKALLTSANSNLTHQYMECLKNDNSCNNNINYKTLLDLDETGYLTFLFCQDNNLFIEVEKVSIDNRENYNYEMSIKQALHKDNAIEWVKILKTLDQLIGSQI